MENQCHNKNDKLTTTIVKASSSSKSEDTIEDTPQTLRCVSDSSEENKSFPDCYQDNDDINEIELYVKVLNQFIIC